MTHKLLELLSQRHLELGQRLLEHLGLTGISVLLAILIGAPLGLWVTRNEKVRGPVLGIVGMVQTVPSLALLGLLLPFLGIGFKPALVALTLYALLPIVRNTYAGLDGVAAELIEAANGLGLTERQRLFLIEFPLALPVIVAGLRTATVISVGIATLAAFIGAGGLGEFIFRGLQTNNNDLILLGAVPAAFLALLLDFAIGRVEASLVRDPVSGRRASAARALGWAIVPAALVAVLALAMAHQASQGPVAQTTGTVTIGSKDFTEQRLIGETMAQLLEARTGLQVDRRLGLAGTQVVHGALVNGDLDLYAEYTGTGLMDILKHDLLTDPDEVYQVVRNGYLKQLNLQWLEPFGFNNTYTITVRGADADAHGWVKVSDLAPDAADLSAGFTGEFVEREDGYPGFQQTYGFGFGTVRTLDPSLMYQAVAQGKVDVICGFGTDGRIPAFKLRVLNDDRHLFPPYYCAPVVRGETLTAQPEIADVLNLLAGRISDATMQRLNYDVDENHRPIPEVAQDFLAELGLLEPDGG